MFKINNKTSINGNILQRYPASIMIMHDSLTGLVFILMFIDVNYICHDKGQT